MKKLKIVHLTDYFIPPMGYQEFYLAKEHQKLGHQVTVVTSDRYFPFTDYQNTVGKKFGPRLRPRGKHLEDGLRVIRLPVLFEHPHGGFIILKQLKNTLEKLNPDIVFADGVFSPVALQIALLKSRFNFRLIYDNHAADFNTNFNGSIFSRLYLLFLRTYHAQKIRQAADRIVAIGTSERLMASRILSISESSIPLIFLGADTAQFRPLSKLRTKTRAKFGFSEKDIVLITAGKVNPHKDIELVIKAIAKISRPHLHLIIAGSGSQDYLSLLNKLIDSLGLNRHIHLTGAYVKSEVSALYNAADIGIWAGDLTNSIQEGMACGLALILPRHITKTQSSAHLLADNGQAFTRGRLPSLVKAIVHLTGNRRRLQLFSTNSLKLSHHRFSWKTIAKQFLQ